MKGKGEKERYILLGASVRNSAHGKGHEEGGSAYAKAGSSLRESPWKFSSIYPQNQSLPTLLCALTYTSDFTGGCPGHDKNVFVHTLGIIKTIGFSGHM